MSTIWQEFAQHVTEASKTHPSFNFLPICSPESAKRPEIGWYSINMSTSDLSNDEEILRHYRHHWGEPLRYFFGAPKAVYPPGPIRVAEFAPEIGDSTRIYVYATIGMSRYPMPYPANWNEEKPERRVELLMYASRETPDAADVIAGLAVYPFFNRTFLGVGHRVSGPKGGGIIEGSLMTDVLLAPALSEPQALRAMHIGGYHVDILWVVPIHPTERAYANEHGWRKLIELFSDAEVDSTDFFRESAV
jgi:hypothetical protein